MTAPDPTSAKSLAKLYPLDFQEHERTRFENDHMLLPVIDKIKSGQNIEQLERFAKAYLGMYLDLDNKIPPNDRIEILANPPLAKDIRAGFETVLEKYSFPTPQQIADSLFDQELPEGYVLLAALDLFADDSRYAITTLPPQTITAAICFHFAYKTEIQNRWLPTTMQERPQETVDAIEGFWLQLIKHGTDHLPGLNQFINQRDYDHLAGGILLPVLNSWDRVRKKVLRKLLHTAIRTTNHDALLNICEAALTNWNPADPGRYILWLTTAFLLAPGRYAQRLAEYTGRTKEKIIPLLDYAFLVLSDDGVNLKLDSESLASLLQIIAPKITPQEDRYGQLCSNTRKVMYLFYQLAISSGQEHRHTSGVLQRLQQVRVMKLYSPVLEYVASVQQSALSKVDTVPEFESFISHLVSQDLITPRIKRYD